jgi:riboflavin kinase / FMN adenylyltransferase
MLDNQAMQVITLSCTSQDSGLRMVPNAPDAPDAGKQVIAIGEFDGVHAGHQEVIRRARLRAEDLNVPLAIMTFHPHPREILGQSKYSRALTPLSEKLNILQDLGVHTTYVVEFSQAFSMMSPEQFVLQVLIPLRPETVVVGFDFAFGHRGSGNPDTLCELGHGRFAVEVVRPVHWNGTKVGSTQIREYLGQGQLEQANALLNRPYSISGTIIHGEARGRQIGFPTANIQPSGSFVLPLNGVYAVRLWLDDNDKHPYFGVANIGRKPTFRADLEEPVLEVHIFDFEQMIYNREARVEFLSFLREERKFSDLDSLIGQIRLDAENARSRIASMKL